MSLLRVHLLALVVLCFSVPLRAQERKIDGIWVVKGVPSQTGGLVHAHILPKGPNAISMSVEGDLSGAIGKGVLLRTSDGKTFSGVAPNGTTAVLEVHSPRRISASLEGTGVHFSFDLVR